MKKYLTPANYPLLCAEWDYDKNEKEPQEYAHGSQYGAWWICSDCKSSYNSSIYARTNNHNCPFCDGKKVNHTNSIQITHPYVYNVLLPEWNIYKNNKKLYEYTYASNNNVWWTCSKNSCRSSWTTKLSNRTIHNSSCPFCDGKQVNHTNSIQITHPYVYNILLPEWDILKNEKQLYNYTYGSGHLTNWICSMCSSPFLDSINHRTSGKRGCPFCAGKQVNHTNSIQITHFDLYNNLIFEWDYNKNIQKLHEYTYGSNYQAWWICPDCHSSYDMKISDRTGLKIKGCPYCSGHRVNQTNSLLSLNPILALEWDYLKNDRLNPTQFTCGSGQKVWWMCLDCKKPWEATIYSRNAGSGCPYCDYKISEGELQWLEYIGIPNDPQHRQVRVITDRKITADGYDPLTKTVYEYYGDYYHGNPKFHDPQEESGLDGKTYGKIYLNTMEKERLFKEAGYKVISIWESDWTKYKKENNITY